MTYQRFEDLPVWKMAMEVGLAVFELVKQNPFRGQGDLADQLRRSALSISNNIAEGFERGAKEELVYFLYVARGSAGETRSGLRFSMELPEMTGLRSEIEPLIEQLEMISRQIKGWADSLQKSSINGSRNDSPNAREAYVKARRSDEFLAKLRKMTEKNLPVRSEEGI